VDIAKLDNVPSDEIEVLEQSAALSGLAMSTLAIWSRVVQSRDVSPYNFDGLAMSVLAISVAPYCHQLWMASGL